MRHKSLSRTDLNILEALQSDGRITNRELARRISLSPSACLARLRALESSGLIAGYQARIALQHVRTIMVVFAEITMQQHAPSAFAHFEAILAAAPEVVEVSRVSGPFDYLLKVAVTDMQEWKELSFAILGEANGVAKLMTLVVMQETKPYVGMPVKASSFSSSEPVPRRGPATLARR